MTMWVVDATLEYIVTPVGEGYKVTCESDFGRREGFFKVDLSVNSRMNEIQKAIEQQKSLDREFVEKLGIELFEMLFSNSKDLLHTCMNQCDHLTIVLKIEDPFLNEIPWELCYDPEHRLYLGADAQVSLVRRDQKSTQQYGKINYPLKVLVIISSPMDLEEKGEFQPNVDEVVELMKSVKDMEDKGTITIDFLERASVRHIQDKIMEGYHIVHFVGHGFYDGKTERGYLVIEDRLRNAKNLEEGGVAQLFGVNPPHLVILTACESSLLIPYLLSKKVPAVLAMQYTVLKDLAYQFMERFYSFMVKGDSIAEAVSKARSAVQLEEGIGCAGWFTPVLYVRADNILQVNIGSPRIAPEKQVPPEIQVHRHDEIIDLLGVQNFVGRRKDLWLMEKALLEDELKVVVVTGIGGIGKTALASKFVEKYKNMFRGVFARKMRDSEMGIEGILGGLDRFFMEYGDQRLHEVIGELDLNVKLVRLNECLKDKYLIVLDNFEPLLKDEKIADEDVERFLRAFLSGDHFSKIIITSRYRFAFKDEKAHSLVKYVDLKELGLRAAVQLLANLGIKDFREGKKIHKKIGGNPQFLELFARLAETRSVEGLLRDVTLLREKIGEWLLHKVMDLLKKEELEVLKKLSAFRLKVERNVFDMLNVSGEVVDKLVHHSLIKVEHGHYFMHQGVRQYVYVLLSDDERVKAHADIVKYYETLFERKYKHIPLPDIEKINLHPQVIQETLSVKEEEDLQDISEFHYHLCESGQYERAGELVIDSVKLYLRQGHWMELMGLLAKTVETTEGILKAAGVHGLGIVFQSLGEYEEAEKRFRKSLYMAQNLGDNQGIAASLYHLGVIHQLRGEYEEAEKLYREALNITENLGDQQGISASYYQIGIVYEKKGLYEEAEELYRESLDITENLDDNQGMAQSYHQLGIIYQLRGEYEGAEEQYRKSLDISEKKGDKQGMAASYHQLGIIHQVRGEYKEAENQYRKSLDISENLGDKQGMAASYHQLGIIHQVRGEYKEAENQYRKSLDISENLGDRKGKARLFHQLGTIYEEQGKYEEAENQYRKSLDISENLGDKQGMAASYHQLGILFQLRGLYEEAQNQYREALDILEDLKDRHGMAASLYQLGIIRQVQRKYEEAETLYRESLNIKRSLKDYQGAARSFYRLGTVFEEQGKYKEALENYLPSLALFLKLDSPDAEEIFRSLLRMRQTLGEERFDEYWRTV
jgi:tetratricopeptide (TPR) repeat protein